MISLRWGRGRALWARAVALACISTLLSLGALVLVPRGLAQEQEPDVIERVVAVVNEEAIFLSDLRRRALPFLPRVLELPTPRQRDEALQQLYGELLTALINEELIEQTAAENQIRVTQQDVDRAIRNVQRQNSLTDDQFWDAVRQQGFSESQYRTDIRRQLLRLKLLNVRARGRVNVTEAQVREEYERQIRRASRRTCFDLAVRVFRAADTTEASFAVACDEAADVQSTTDATTFGGTELGTVCEGAMQGQIEQAVRSLDAGEISAPIRTETGCLLVHVRDVTNAEGEVPSYDEAKDRIYRQMVEEAMARQEQSFVDELRRGALVDRRL